MPKVSTTLYKQKTARILRHSISGHPRVKLKYDSVIMHLGRKAHAYFIKNGVHAHIKVPLTCI